MTRGVITGGWGFVWAVYGLSLTIFTIYTVSVFLRWKHALKKLKSRK